MTVFFVEKPPDRDLLHLFSQPLVKSLSSPPVTPPELDTEESVIMHNEIPAPGTDKDNLVTVPVVIVMEPEVFKFDEKSTKFLQTNSNVEDEEDDQNDAPITVKHITDKTFINDEIDFVADNTLLLTESLQEVIDNMTDTILNTELIRHHSSTLGSIEDKRRRLAALITLMIGDLSNNARRIDPIQLLRMESTDTSQYSTRQDHDALYNTQQNMEKALKDLVDDVNNIRTEVSHVQSANVTSNDDKKPAREEEKCKEDQRQLHKDCSYQTKTLSETLAGLKDEVNDTKAAIVELQRSVVTTRRDLDEWYSSAFYHEDKAHIKQILDIVSANTSVRNSHEDPVSTLTESVVTVDDKSGSSTPTDEQEDGDTLPTFAELTQRKNTTKVCLITDSIMRHINDLGEKFTFTRFDNTNTKGLMSSSTRQKLKSIQPDYLYIHLGINDVHDPNTTVEQSMINISDFIDFVAEELTNTYVVYSLPLLNGNVQQYDKLYELRRKITALVSNIYDNDKQSGQCVDQWLFTNYNHNFTDGPMKQKLRLFNVHKYDPVHLSRRGKISITCNLRDAIYKIKRGCNFFSS